MGNQKFMTLTYAGRDLAVPHFTEGVEGKVGDLIFSRIVAGDDILPDDVNLRALTEIESPKMEFPVVACEIKEYNGERCAFLEAALQSIRIEEGFRIRIVGIYAKDPYTDMEILYAVSHFPQTKTTTTDENGNITTVIEETGEWMPAIGEARYVDTLYTVITVIGQAENVICNIVDDIIHVTIKEFRDHIDEKNPHPNMPHLAGQLNGNADYFLGKNAGNDNFYQIPFASVINQILPETVSKIGVSGDATGTVTTNKSTGKTDIKLTNIIATRLKNPRTISITGKARGSASFDGSANVSLPLSGVDADTLSGKTLQWILDQIGAIQQTVANMDDGLPIGTILPYGGAIEDIPAGWSLCDGKNGTPDLRDRFLMGWGGNAAGKPIDAGLPNIKGAFGRHQTVTANGAFAKAVNSSVSENVGIGGETTHNAINFDAAKGTYTTTGSKMNEADSPYGKSDTVQPPAYTVYFIMKTGTTAAEGGES